MVVAGGGFVRRLWRFPRNAKWPRVCSVKISLNHAAAGFWLLALLFSFPWVQAREPETTALALIALMAAAAFADSAGLKARVWFMPVSAVLVCLGGLWALTLVSAAFSEVFFVSWIYFFIFSTLPLTLGVFLLGRDTPEKLAIAWRGAQGLLALLSVYALWQYFFRPELLFEGRVHEPLTDPNGLAAIFSLGLFMQMRDLTTAAKRTLPGVTLFFLLLAAFLTTGSRTAFLSFALLLAIVPMAAGWRILSRREWGGLLGLVVLAVLTASLVTPTYFAGPLKLAYYSYLNGWEFIFGSRGLLWDSTLELIGRHPWTGTGIGTFYLYYPEVRDPLDTTAGFMAHNDTLQFAAEAGIGAACVFVLLCALGVVRTIRAVRRVPRNDPARLAILFPALGLGAMVLHTQMTFNLHVMACLLMTGLVFAVWHQASGTVLDRAPHRFTVPASWPTPVIQAGLVLMAVIMAVLAAVPIYTQALLREAEASLMIGDVEDFADRIDLANFLSRRLNYQPYAIAARIPLGVLMQTEEPLPDADRQRILGEADRLLERAAFLNPRDVGVLRQQAQLAGVRGDIAVAEEKLRAALRLNARYLSARMDLATLLEETGREAEGTEVLAAGLSLTYDPRMQDALRSYYLRTLLMLEAAGRKDEAATVKKRLKTLF